MNVYVDSITSTNNFKLISDRNKGEWLEADDTGRLFPVRGRFEKASYLLRNRLSFGEVNQRTERAITKTCKDFFEKLCCNCPSPLQSDSPLLSRYSSEIFKVAASVERIPLCDKGIAQKFKTLTYCPEIVEATLAVEKGISPELIESGVSGSYILYNRWKQPWAVFKPKELEAGCKGNPKGYGESIRLQDASQIQAGSSYVRERAAYLLDHDHFANVPLTQIAKFPGGTFAEPKYPVLQGSFQKFVPECSVPKWLSVDDIDKIPAAEIRKIAILDIRLLNCDRHLENFLVDSDYNTHPIDHGYILPGRAFSIRFDWMELPQSKEPFSEEEREYIERLDPRADAERLKEQLPLIPEDSLTRMVVAGLLLKQAAERGLTPFQIGEWMTQGDCFFEKSIFPKIAPLLSASEEGIQAALDVEIDVYLKSIDQ